MTVLAPNLTKKPFDDVKFREALAYGIDKQSATTKATYGIMEVASQSGLALPGKTDLLPAQYPADTTVIPYDLAKANQLLDAAGYPKGSTACGPTGRLTDQITFSVQAGCIDYEAMADELTSNFRELGMDITANKMPPDSVDGQKKTGDFQLMINFMGAGCDYANGMGATLSRPSSRTRPTSRAMSARYTNPAVDKAIGALAGDDRRGGDEGTGRCAGRPR